MPGQENNRSILSEPHAIIVGFGVPGRFIGELLDFRGMPYVVIESNPVVAERCTIVPIILGDARLEETLQRAGIEHATLLALTPPMETVVHEVITAARRLRTDLRIVARVNYTSAALKAQQLGADEVVVGEQLIAREFFRLIESHLVHHHVPSSALSNSQQR
jgi:voltage-gated potassium channel